MSGASPYDYLRDEYLGVQHIYKMLAERTEHLLIDLAKGAGILAFVESREKTVDSFIEKVGRPGKDYSAPLEEISDLAGARVTLQSLRDVDRFCQVIRGEFAIDEARSVDKLEQLSSREFGYLSKHFVVQIKEPRLLTSEWAFAAGRAIEIQVRTILQDAWARLEHLLVYKSQRDVPQSLRRRFNAVAAVLEIMDRELDALLDAGQQLVEGTKAQLLRHGLHIPITVESLGAYLQSSDNVRRLAETATSLNVAVDPASALGQDVALAEVAGVTEVAALDEILESSMGWAGAYFSEYFRLRGLAFGVSPESIDLNGVVRLLLVGAHIDGLTAEVLQREYGVSEAWLCREAARVAKGGSFHTGGEENASQGNNIDA